MSKDGKKYRIDHHLSKIEDQEKNQFKNRIIIGVTCIFFVIALISLLYPKQSNTHTASNEKSAISAVKAIPVNQNFNQPKKKIETAEKFADNINPKSKEENKSTTNKINKPANFPGGKMEMERFLKENVIYPQIALDRKISGKVNVKIKISPEGKILSKKIVKSLQEECDKEVLRAISSMPDWDPALKDGKNVTKSYIITVTFDLPK